MLPIAREGQYLRPSLLIFKMMRETEPIFVLRGINIKEFVVAAIDDSLIPPTWPKQRVKTSVMHTKRAQDTTTENKPTDAVYCTRRDNKLLRVHTTGNNLYDSVIVDTTGGVEYRPRKSSTTHESCSGTTTSNNRIISVSCVHCRQIITHDYIPSIITHCSGMIFEGYDPACSARCAQAHLNNERLLRPTDTTLKRSSDYLNRFCDVAGLLAPGDAITAAPDWRTHWALGGSLSDEEFYRGKQHFVLQPGVYIVPVKLSYISTSNNTDLKDVSLGTSIHRNKQ